MRWIQYPTDADRQAVHPVNGIPREGQIWADAPGPRKKWVIPTTAIGERAFALVVVYENAPERNYALDDWQGAVERPRAKKKAAAR